MRTHADVLKNANKDRLVPFKKADPNIVQFARKVRLDMDADAAGRLDGQSKICNWLWNRLKDQVEARLTELFLMKWLPIDDEATTKKLLSEVYSEIGLRNLVPVLKDRHPFLRCVHSSPLKNVALRMAKAITAHRKSKNGERAGPDVGWIKYKAWAKQWMSLEYDEPNKGWDVSEFGWLKLSFGTDCDGKRLSLKVRMIKPPKHITQAHTCRIVREGKDRYYAAFTFKKQKKAERPLPRVAYIDPNLKNFGYALDTEGKAFEIQNLQKQPEVERTLDSLRAKRDRCQRKSLWVDHVHADGTRSTHWRPSRKWTKLDRVITRLEIKVREQRKHFQYSLANQLFRHYDVVGIGDYVPENTDHGKGRKYNRAVRNRSMHGSFKDVLKWMATRSGKRAVVLDETGTTRTCHVCNHVVEGGIHPSIREWNCPQCSTHHARDENASQNGLRRLLEFLRAGADIPKLPCLGPVQIIGRCDWRFHPQGWQGTPNGGANVNSMRLPEYRQRCVGRGSLPGGDSRAPETMRRFA